MIKALVVVGVIVLVAMVAVAVLGACLVWFCRGPLDDMDEERL